MALRVAGDADLVERMAELGHRLEERRRRVEDADRLFCVTGDDEHVVYPDPAQARNDLRQVGGVDDEARGEVRHDRIPVTSETLDRVQRVPDPASR